MFLKVVTTKLHQHVFVTHSQTTLHSCGRLALLLYKLGKADEAKELCKEAAQLCVQQSPPGCWEDKQLVRMSWGAPETCAQLVRRS